MIGQPILTLGGRNSMVAGSLGDTTSLSRAMAMAKRYGPCTTMLTLTPDDINSPTSFRLAARSLNNMTFPACVDETFFVGATYATLTLAPVKPPGQVS